MLIFPQWSSAKLILCLFRSTLIAPIKYIWSLYIPKLTQAYLQALLYQQLLFSHAHIISISANDQAGASLAAWITRKTTLGLQDSIQGTAVQADTVELVLLI